MNIKHIIVFLLIALDIVKAENSYGYSKKFTENDSVAQNNKDKVNKSSTTNLLPLSLGIETTGRIMTTIIPRHTVIPAKRSLTVSTSYDNQETILVAIFEGEQVLTRENHKLGELELSGIIPAPRGVPQIKVLFDIDASGTLKVSVLDKVSGGYNSVHYTNEGRLSKDEIQIMLHEKKEWEEEEPYILKRVESKRKLENFIYSLRMQLEGKDHNLVRISDTDRDTIRRAIREKINWLDENVWALHEEFETKREELLLLVNK